MTDNPPSLANDSDSITGDEPVLKGVNSQVLADRRGIYLTAMVDDEQQAETSI